MPPALRGLCEAVMVIGVSFKYCLAAFRTRDRSKTATLNLACAEVGPKTANTKAAIVSRRVILSLGARASRHSFGVRWQSRIIGRHRFGFAFLAHDPNLSNANQSAVAAWLCRRIPNQFALQLKGFGL